MAMLNNQVVGISSEYPAKISIFLEVGAPCCIGGLSILGVACKPRHGPEGLGTSKKSGQCHCCLGYHFWHGSEYVKFIYNQIIYDHII